MLPSRGKLWKLQCGELSSGYTSKLINIRSLFTAILEARRPTPRADKLETKTGLTSYLPKAL